MALEIVANSPVGSGCRVACCVLPGLFAISLWGRLGDSFCGILQAQAMHNLKAVVLVNRKGQSNSSLPHCPSLLGQLHLAYLTSGGIPWRPLLACIFGALVGLDRP